MVTHFFLYLAVVDITSIWSRIDWAYMWFIITWDFSSGRSTGSRCSGGSWLSTKFVNCGGTMGGPAAADKLVLSSLGLCWPHSLSLYLDSNDLKLKSWSMMTSLNKITLKLPGGKTITCESLKDVDILSFDSDNIGLNKSVTETSTCLSQVSGHW